MVQEPAPEINQLRQGRAFHSPSVEVSPQQPVHITGLTGARFDLTFTLQPGNKGAAGVLLRSWLHKGSGPPHAAAIIFSWDKQTLEVSAHWRHALSDKAKQ